MYLTLYALSLLPQTPPKLYSITPAPPCSQPWSILPPRSRSLSPSGDALSMSGYCRPLSPTYNQTPRAFISTGYILGA